MYPAFGAARLDRVAAKAAPAGQQAFGVGGHVLDGHARHLDVRRPAQQVLAALGPAHGFVVGGGAVAAGDGHGLAKVLPDALQKHHKAFVDHHDVGAVAAAELAYLKARCQQFGTVLGKTVLLDCHRLTPRSYCRSFRPAARSVLCTRPR